MSEGEIKFIKLLAEYNDDLEYLEKKLKEVKTLESEEELI